MSIQTYLIDTNVIIGLEDHRTVQPGFAALLSIASKHKVDVLVHEAARDDIQRDKDVERRKISLSKLEKFQLVKKVRGLEVAELERKFGPLSRPNDVVDATLLDAIERGAADFLVTEDRGLHERARRASPELGRRVLFVADAVALLRTTYEPVETPVRYVEEVSANEIKLTDEIFDSLREDYPPFDTWWREKCVRERRNCWAVFDDGLAGLIVRKDETRAETDATIKADKILKICTFKVRPEKRGVKLGELLLKKVFWFAQANKYDIAYVTTYATQAALIDLLEYYGFVHTKTKDDGELVYEKEFSRASLAAVPRLSDFELDRLNYPRFITGPTTRAFVAPIKEGYHDTLYPDLKNPEQPDLFELVGVTGSPKRPGNTIRKVYLCRAQSNLGLAGSLLFFYKGKSNSPPSQALTAVGVFEEVSVAASTKELMQLTGGRSVYSEAELNDWQATAGRKVKVINYLLAAYIDPPIGIDELRGFGIIKGHPPQSIFEPSRAHLEALLPRLKSGVFTMTPPVVALAGLSGVGKSTLLARLKNTVPMQILQASALIKEARMSTDGEAITLDALRAVDLDENQLLLAEGFARRVDLAARLIVLDCHVVIETPDGLVRIDPRVYSAMEVRVFLYLEDEPEEIARRRKNDTTRQRPVTATENIGLVQVEAIRHARAIAAALNIPLYIHRPAGEEDAITKLLRSYQAPGGT